MGEDLIGDRIFFNNDKFAIDINGEVCKPTIKEDMCKCIFFYKHKEKWVRFECLLCGIENATDEKVESIKQFAKGFFIKESEKSMITDEQGREWLLQKLYDEGWKYYVKNIGDTAFVTTKRPVMNDGILDINSGGHVKCINNISKIMPKIECNEVLDIAEELGIVDWSKIEVDTPIFVRNSIAEVWKCRYFAKYEDGKVYTWRDGKTSWSNVVSDRPVAWGYAELAFKG